MNDVAIAVYERMLRDPNSTPEERRCAANAIDMISRQNELPSQEQ